MNAHALETVARSSSRRLSIWAMPVSHWTGTTVTDGLAACRSSQGATWDRTSTRTSGLRSIRTFASSMHRDAWPNPWPEM
jgi:hypothetical protein